MTESLPAVRRLLLSPCWECRWGPGGPVTILSAAVLWQLSSSHEQQQRLGALSPCGRSVLLLKKHFEATVREAEMLFSS